MRQKEMLRNNMNAIIGFINEYPFFKVSLIVIAFSIELLIALKIGDSIGRFVYYIKHG
ncbi:hypothetical protein DFR58_12233 [Anaerobacterium chartisolvens]|uniref:Uncharacterized protein n=1 Tax=Anaerobacterium chartisolvens TaxID=1297424 RepID=A0A369AY33_9FIRM|nr:hypothetical protein DFR58_12233 [Anaerobacterium chartisolvens]